MILATAKVLTALVIATMSTMPTFADPKAQEFTSSDIQFLTQFTLTKLPPPPPAPSNKFADNIQAAELGHKIFFDTGFSLNQKIACSSCHRPEHYFTDGLKVGQGIGATRRNTPSLLGAAYGPWKYWDGRKDSLWAQALEPLEHHDEQGFSRSQVYQRIVAYYRQDYEDIFGKLQAGQPEIETAVFVNVGKSLMAYQRRLTLPPSRFDLFVETLTAENENTFEHLLSNSEIRGLRLFMGKAACASCHNGPLFTNFEFHNVGAPEPNKAKVDLGRFAGIEQLRHDEFNCLSKWSDAGKNQCQELDYLKTQGPELVGAFKTPSLRNVAATAPYMHGGQLASLEAVIQHYNKPSPPFFDPQQHPNRPHFDVLPLQLSEQGIQDLIAFLQTLTSPMPTRDKWWHPPSETPTP